MKIKEFIALSPERRNMLLQLDLSDAKLAEISHTDFSDFISMLSQCTSLQNINLSRNKLDLLGCSQLANLANTLAKITTLKKLNLSYNSTMPWDAKSFKVFWQNLAVCVQLEELNLGHNQIVNMIQEVASNGYKYDRVRFAPVLEAFTAFFNALANFKNLKQLDLSGNDFGALLSENFAVVNRSEVEYEFNETFTAILQTYVQLETFNLSDNRLADIAREDGRLGVMIWDPFITALSQLPSLIELNLSGNQLNNCNQMKLQSLFTNLTKTAKLRHLDLKNNFLSRLEHNVFDDIALMIETSSSLQQVGLEFDTPELPSPAKVDGFHRLLVESHNKHPLSEINLCGIQFGNDTNITQIVLRLFNYLSDTCSLLHIDLSGNHLGNLPLNDFQELCNLLGRHSQLKTIRLSNNSLENLDKERISILANLLVRLDSLELIDFQSNYLPKLPIESFKILCNGLAQCQLLRKIGLVNVLVFYSSSDGQHHYAPNEYFSVLKAALSQCKSLLQIHTLTDPECEHQNELDQICNAHLASPLFHLRITNGLFRRFPHVQGMILGFAHPQLPAEMFKSLDNSLRNIMHQRLTNNNNNNNNPVDHNGNMEPDNKRHKTARF